MISNDSNDFFSKKKHQLKLQMPNMGAAIKLTSLNQSIITCIWCNKLMSGIKAQIGLHDWLRVHSYFFWSKKKWWKDEEDRCNSAKVLLNTQTGQNQLCLQKCLQITLKLKISYILVKGLMANFQSWGYQTKNVDFLLTNAPIQKLTLLVKILSDVSQI